MNEVSLWYIKFIQAGVVVIALYIVVMMLRLWWWDVLKMREERRQRKFYSRPMQDPNQVHDTTLGDLHEW